MFWENLVLIVGLWTQVYNTRNKFYTGCLLNITNADEQQCT